LIHSPACSALSAEIEADNADSIGQHAADFSKFHSVQVLSDPFNDRFSDFRQSSEQFRLFNDPFSAAIENQPDNLQLELCELQSDDFLLGKYSSIRSGLEFWTLLAKAQ
jgi:hypothetical protein